MILPFDPHTPSIAAGAWVAPTAMVIGDVVIEEGASIWYGAVIRADRARIRGQDGAADRQHQRHAASDQAQPAMQLAPAHRGSRPLPSPCERGFIAAGS